MAKMAKTKSEPTQIQDNLDNRYKTLQGGMDNTYDSEPDEFDEFGFYIGPPIRY